jgi:predicted nuclease with TOPRIM domain
MGLEENPEACAGKLVQKFNQLTEISQAIRKLSETQQAMVKDDKETELLSLLSDKQILIDRHEKLFAETQDLRTRWEVLKSRVSAAARQQVETAWEKLRTTITEVVSLEDTSRSILQEKQKRVTIDLGKIQRGRITNKAYGNSRPAPNPRYSDHQG